MVNATLETHKNKQIFSIHIMTHSFHSSFLPSFPFILYLLYNIVNHIFMCGEEIKNSREEQGP